MLGGKLSPYFLTIKTYVERANNADFASKKNYPLPSAPAAVNSAAAVQNYNTQNALCCKALIAYAGFFLQPGWQGEVSLPCPSGSPPLKVTPSACVLLACPMLHSWEGLYHSLERD